MEFVVKYKGRKLVLKVRKTNSFNKYLGLMFRTKMTRNLLFDYGRRCRRGIHSYFVFFPFLIVWMDEGNEVLEWQIVKPFTFLVVPQKEFRRFVEVPVNESNKRVLDFFVGK